MLRVYAPAAQEGCSAITGPQHSTPDDIPAPSALALPDELERARLHLALTTWTLRRDAVRADTLAEEAAQRRLSAEIERALGAWRREVEELTAAIARLEARLERLEFASRALSDDELDGQEYDERAGNAAFWAEWRQQREERNATRDWRRAETRDRGVRRLYLALARLIHPDLARNEVDRQRRETVMRLANIAYEVGDADQLRRLLSVWSEPDSQREPRDLGGLRELIEKRRVETGDLQQQLLTLQRSQLGRMVRGGERERRRYVEDELERLRRELAGLRMRRRRLTRTLDARRRELSEVSD